MWLWLEKLWNTMLRVFKAFIDAAIPAITQIIIAELKDYAINVVGTLENTDLSNDEKRKEAFNQIKQEAINRGKDISDSLVNFLLELALQYIKNKF